MGNSTTAATTKMTLFFLATIISGCALHQTPPTQVRSENTLNPIAEKYVKLVLALGEHDRDYVDVYYGPPSWLEEIKSHPPSKNEIKKEALELLEELRTIPLSMDRMSNVRKNYLQAQLESLCARVDLVQGVKMSFDQEAEALYGIKPPAYNMKDFDKYLNEIDSLLPGTGSLAARYQEFKKEYIIPRDKLEVVMQHALSACREKTKQFVLLPKDESFEVEYVTDKPWGAYNWYLGNFQSLIQFNHEHPIFIGDALRAACHEGYPGHHVNLTLLEKRMVKERGWLEFTVYALFSPQSLVAEGTANYGIELVFPIDERATFERDVLYPLAGLNPEKAQRYFQINRLVRKLRYLQIETARRFLDGEISARQTADQLERYTLLTRDRAKRLVRFFQRYRSYIVNYTLGEDLVHANLKQKGKDIESRWRIFTQLISTPRLLAEPKSSRFENERKQ